MSDPQPSTESSHQPEDGNGRQSAFGIQGIVLTSAVFVAFLVIPSLIYLSSIGWLGIPLRFAYLILPLGPAVILALLAVYVASS